MQKALPWVLGGCMLGMVAIMIFSGVRQLSPYMLMMPLMMVMGAVGLVAGGGSGGKKVPEINADRKEYLRYLANLRTRVTSSAAAQVTFFNYHAPHPDDLLSVIGTHRQWSRASNADFYAATRIGLGSEAAVDRLLKPAVGGDLAGPAGAPQPHLEPVSHMWVTKFLRTHGLLHDCPKLVQLRTFPSIAVGGDLEGSSALLRAMICHLAVFHPPDMLQIRVLTDNPEDPNWAWVKWLPHVQHQSDTDAAGTTRMVFTRPDGLSDLAARGPHTADATPNGPYVVVVDLTGGRAGFPADGRAGVTVLTLGNHRSSYRIRVDADGTADDKLANQTFRLVTSRVDSMTPGQAERVARKLAGWSITGTIIDKSTRVQKKVATEWHEIVGAQTVEEVTPARWRMFTDTDRDRLRIPFGHELKTGDVMHLDIKEGAEFGAGPHGMLIGTTGSGKSEFLRTLILSLAATHHPDQINLLLTDFKGGSTFLGMEKLPHTAAVVTNMEEEAELVSRMGEVLTGELDRRQSILRQAGIQVGAAGALSGVAEYEKHRERGADLPPLPTLFVVVDEFAELLQNHPDFIQTVRPDLSRRPVAAGASAAGHPVAEHRRYPHRQAGAEPDLPDCVAHHQFRGVQGSDRNPGGAVHLEQGERRGLPARRNGGPGEVPERVHRQPVRAHRGGGGRRGHGAAQPRRQQCPDPPLHDGADPRLHGALMTIDSGQKVLREVVLEQLTTGENHAYRMWLPPLADPTPVNELVARDYERRPLRVGIGVMDEPRRHRQEVWGIDISTAAGNVAIGGAPQTGKSTFLQTFILSAAASHTPRQIQFYCVDMGGGGLMYIEDLPHVGGVATRAEPDRVNRVVAEVKAVLRQREQTFKQYRVGSMADYRQMREDPENAASADPFGDVFLVIDGWPAFAAEFVDLEPVVQDLAGQGLAYGVHVMISTPRWTELKARVRDYLGTKVEFRLGDVNETQIDRITREIPVNRPGRAVSTRETPSDDRGAAPRRRAQRREPGARDVGRGARDRGAAHR